MLTGDTEVALMALRPCKYFAQTLYVVRCVPIERLRDSHRTRPAHKCSCSLGHEQVILLVAALPAQEANDGDRSMATAYAPMEVGRAGRSSVWSQPYAARQRGDWCAGMT